MADRFFIPNIAGTNVDAAYVNIRDSEFNSDVRKYIENCYEEYQFLCPDKNFLKQAQENFHPMTWQMHLTILLKRKGIKVLPPTNTWPDILLEYEGKKYF